MYRFAFKTLAFILIFFQCNDLPRDNVLDPGNPNSYQSSVILVEAFVNTNNPFPYNEWALQALDSLEVIYGSKIVIVEYHRDTQEFSDPYSQPLIVEPLYEKYVQNSVIKTKGVPDIFINGYKNRIQGASSVESVLSRVNTVLSSETGLNNYFTLEPTDIVLGDNQLRISCKIARLGNQSASNLLLRAILVKRINSQALKRVAIHIVKTEQISKMEAGDIRTIDFEPIVISQVPDFIILSVTSANELVVYQNLKADL